MATDTGRITVMATTGHTAITAGVGVTKRNNRPKPKPGTPNLVGVFQSMSAAKVGDPAPVTSMAAAIRVAPYARDSIYGSRQLGLVFNCTRLDWSRGHCGDGRQVASLINTIRDGRSGNSSRPKMLATDGKLLSVVMSAIRPSVVVRRSNINRRWRYINRRRWRVIDRWWRGDINRSRCNRAANQSSNTESQ
jgi:hypothetical protein